MIFVIMNQLVRHLKNIIKDAFDGGLGQHFMDIKTMSLFHQENNVNKIMTVFSNGNNIFPFSYLLLGRANLPNLQV